MPLYTGALLCVTVYCYLRLLVFSPEARIGFWFYSKNNSGRCSRYKLWWIHELQLLSFVSEFSCFEFMEKPQRSDPGCLQPALKTSVVYQHDLCICIMFSSFGFLVIVWFLYIRILYIFLSSFWFEAKPIKSL